MDTQRCPGIRLQLDALPALRIGEEAEAALVHPLHQNHAHAGPAVRSRGGQSCGVGIVRFAALRLLQPVFEECDWILRLKIHGSMVACDSIEERSGERFHVDGRTSAAGATYRDLIPAMRKALMDFSAGRVQQPVRTIIPVAEHGGWLGVMPAVYGSVMGAQMVTFYRGNAMIEKHTHMAVIQLFRSDTGEPLMTMDGRLITEMRTAAVSAVAVDHLAVPQAKVLAILGSGVQARSHMR